MVLSKSKLITRDTLPPFLLDRRAADEEDDGVRLGERSLKEQTRAYQKRVILTALRRARGVQKQAAPIAGAEADDSQRDDQEAEDRSGRPVLSAPQRRLILGDPELARNRPVGVDFELAERARQGELEILVFPVDDEHLATGSAVPSSQAIQRGKTKSALSWFTVIFKRTPVSRFSTWARDLDIGQQMGVEPEVEEGS